MTELYVCGDSYALYHEGLDWGQILANNLGFSVKNTSKEGSSNYEIFFKTLFDNFYPSDRIVIVGWSFPHRTVYWNHKDHIARVNKHYENISDPNRPLGFYDTLNEKVNNDLAKELYKLQLLVNPTREPEFIDTINYMIALDGFLTSRNIKHLFLSARQWDSVYNRNFTPLDKMLDYLTNLSCLVNPETYGYIEDAIQQGYDHSHTKHLSQDGHEYVAKKILQFLNEKYEGFQSYSPPTNL